MTIGERFRHFRQLKGISGNRMAEKLHMGQSNYSKLERDMVTVSYDKIEDFCNAIEVSLCQFFDDSGVSLSDNESEMIKTFRCLKPDDQFVIKSLIDLIKNKDQTLK